MRIGSLYILTPNFFKHYEKLSEEAFLYGEEAILTGQINIKLMEILNLLGYVLDFIQSCFIRNFSS